MILLSLVACLWENTKTDEQRGVKATVLEHFAAVPALGSEHYSMLSVEGYTVAGDTRCVDNPAALSVKLSPDLRYVAWQCSDKLQVAYLEDKQVLPACFLAEVPLHRTIASFGRETPDWDAIPPFAQVVGKLAPCVDANALVSAARAAGLPGTDGDVVVSQVRADAVGESTLYRVTRLPEEERVRVREALVPMLGRSSRPETFHLAGAAGADPAVVDALAARVRGDDFDRYWGDEAVAALIVLDPVRAASVGCEVLPRQPADPALYAAVAAAPNDCAVVLDAVRAGGDTVCSYAEGEDDNPIVRAVRATGGPHGADQRWDARLHYRMVSPETPECDDRDVAPNTDCRCRWTLCEVFGLGTEAVCEPKFDDARKTGWYVPHTPTPRALGVVLPP